VKKNIFIFFYFFLPCYSHAQNNLVGNPGFEIISPAGFGPCLNNSYSHYYDQVHYWGHQSPWTVPKSPLYCSNSAGVGTSDWDCDGGHTGLHYGFCQSREYIVAQLLTPMIQGKEYYVEFYVRGIETRNNSGIKFFGSQPTQCGGYEISNDGPADIGIWSPISSTSWTKIARHFTALHPYSWIGLGSFDCKKNDCPAYSFDDIKVIDIGSGACPDVNYIQNTTFQDIGKITYPSQTLTIAGNNVGGTPPTGNVIIGNNAIVEFKSAKQVILEPGFSVDAGAYFEARIAPCDADCFPAIANAGADAISCGTQTIQLGSPSSEFELTYSWSANPSSTLAYLSNTTIPNPVFTPPASGNGRIVYTLTATNACGKSVTDDVIISYEANPNNSPTVSVSNINYSDLIEFDATFGSHTEQLIIEVLTAGGNLVNTYTYTVGVDMNCCTYHWKIPAGLDPCQDYLIKVKTKNFCSSVFSAEYIINWTRNSNLSFIYVPNIITPNQPVWCFSFTGATQYHVTITNRYGTPIYVSSGIITPPSACVWNGECNQPACSQSTISDGTYYYDLTINGCNGKTADNVGFITVLHGHKMNPQITDSTQETIASKNFNSSEVENNKIKVEIYPNPNAGSFTIKLAGSSDQKTNNKIIIYDAMGNSIQKTEMLNEAITIDISAQPKGMYFIKIENEQGIKVEKIIYQ